MSGGRLRVRAVVEARPPLSLGYAALHWEDVKASLSDQLASAVEGFDGDVQTEVITGFAATELHELSRSADLLVIGSRRWGAIARVISGSTGEALLHGGACCPVMLVPRPRQNAAG